MILFRSKSQSTYPHTNLVWKFVDAIFQFLFVAVKTKRNNANISRNKRRCDLQSNLSAFKKLNPRDIFAKGCLKGKDAQKPVFGTNDVTTRAPTGFDTCVPTLIFPFSLLRCSQYKFYLRRLVINIFLVLSNYMPEAAIRCCLLVQNKLLQI